MDILEELNSGQPENGEATPAAEVTTEAPAETATETPAEAAARERDERGRFKAKETDQPMVPLNALHETRDKVRALEAELQQLRTPQQAPAVPDIFENPEGFTGHIQNQLHMATLNTTLNLSESMAKRYAGAETVEQAKQWGVQAFQANPVLYQQFLQQPDPYGFLIDQHKRAETLTKLGDDPSQIEQFLAWKEAQANPQPTPAPIPTSLASQQSARGDATPYQPPSLEQLLKG